MGTTSLPGNTTHNSTSHLNGSLALNTTPRKLGVEWTPLNKNYYQVTVPANFKSPDQTSHANNATS